MLAPEPDAATDYSHLDEDARLLCRGAAIYPGRTLALDVLAAITALSTDRTRAALHRLVEAGLARAVHAGEKAALLDGARAHARRQTSPTADGPMIRRATGLAVQNVTAVADILRTAEASERRARALTWLDDQAETITHLLTQQDPADPAPGAVDLALAMSPLVEHRPRPQVWRSIDDAAWRLARAATDPEPRLRLQVRIGIRLYTTGEGEHAAACLHHALRLSQDLGRQRDTANIRCHLGVAALYIDGRRGAQQGLHYVAAARTAQQALRLHDDEADTLTAMARAYLLCSRPGDAAACLNAAQQLHPTPEWGRDARIQLLTLLAHPATPVLQRCDRAEQVLDAAQQSGSWTLEAHARLTLATLLADTEPAGAHRHLQAPRALGPACPEPEAAALHQQLSTT